MTDLREKERTSSFLKCRERRRKPTWHVW